MSNEAIERATTSTADMVAAGLEQHARAITARVIQLLAEDRKSILGDVDDMRTMIGAVAQELVDSRKEARDQRSEMLFGIHGLQQQLSEYEALIPPHERVRIAEMVYRHDEEIKALIAWRASLEARDGG